MKVALELGRHCVGIELNPSYVRVIKERVPVLRKSRIRYIGESDPKATESDKG